MRCELELLERMYVRIMGVEVCMENFTCVTAFS